MTIADDEFERTIINVRKRPSGIAPPAEEIGHYLLASKAGEPPRRVEVGAQPITIGRDPKQALALADTEVSRLHARVFLSKGAAVVEDMGSTNGTFLDGRRLTVPVELKLGAVLRLGSYAITYERRSRRDVDRAEDLDRDLQRAGEYVLALLPPPVLDGPVRADWRFVPSAHLGGDAFGYNWLDPDTFLFYLVDVAGHGAKSAMHSVTVLNLLRQRALPGIDFADPSSVLASLNERFQMDTHGGLLFTMWYGVYSVRNRTVTFSAAGHHPAYLIAPDKSASVPLGLPALMIGAMPGLEFDVRQATVPAGGSICLFSDGVFEVVTTDQTQWTLNDFEPLLIEPALPGVSEADRLFRAVKRVTGQRPFDDDASLVVLTFP